MMSQEGPHTMQARVSESRFPRPFAAIGAIALLIGLLCHAPQVRAAQPESKARDLWYTLWIDGVRSGYSRQTITTAEDRISTSSRTSLAIKRGPVEMSIVMESTFVESLDGKPIWTSSEQRIGALPVKTTVEFLGETMKITRTQAGMSSTETQDAPAEPWLTPAAAERFMLQRMRAGASEIVLRTLDPAAGLSPITITRTGFREDSETIGERTIPTMVARSTISYMPGVEMIEEFDTEGTTVRTETPMAGMVIVSILADEATALADVKGGAEVMVRSLITPDRPIGHARNLKKSVLRLSIASGEMPELPSTGAQRVEAIDGRTARLTIDTAAGAPAPESDRTDPAYLKSTLMCQSDDGEIRALVAKATSGAGASKVERAEAMRRFVRKYLDQKSLDVGFGSALETARTRSGDCTEHAVLLAAMLRADGIPARGVTGLVYVDQFLGESGVFGYHMWTQALLEVDGVSTWVDLDAAIDDTRAFDASHIACSLVAFADSETTEAFQAIIPLMGSLTIEVESLD